ncbi:hypothetical protein GOV10_03640 [Candidatus Woesearchaeota archaeon]|nr:hypothetical protein [Candidatus Woesearchaeota archaeon]
MIDRHTTPRTQMAIPGETLDKLVKVKTALEKRAFGMKTTKTFALDKALDLALEKLKNSPNAPGTKGALYSLAVSTHNQGVTA